MNSTRHFPTVLCGSVFYDPPRCQIRFGVTEDLPWDAVLLCKSPVQGKRFSLFRWRFHGRSPDRKSTRLNSSHVAISYAVFCLQKKKSEERAGQAAPHRRRDSSRTPIRRERIEVIHHAV